MLCNNSSCNNGESRLQHTWCLMVGHWASPQMHQPLICSTMLCLSAALLQQHGTCNGFRFAGDDVAVQHSPVTLLLHCLNISCTFDLTQSVFLGSLTAIEASRLTQRLLKYLLFKVALVGMVVLPNEVQLLHWLPW